MRRAFAALALLLLSALPVSAQVTWSGPVDKYVVTNTTKAALMHIGDRWGGTQAPLRSWTLEPDQWWTIIPRTMLEIPSNAVALDVSVIGGTSGALRFSSWGLDAITYCSGYFTTRPINSNQPSTGYNLAWSAPAVPAEPLQRADMPLGNGVNLVGGGEREAGSWKIPLTDAITGLPVGAFEAFWHNENWWCSGVVTVEVTAYYLPQGEAPGPILRGAKFW